MSFPNLTRVTMIYVLVLNDLEPVVCTATQWQCQNMHCISDVWHCDGDMDCQDGSDERNCSGIAGLLKPCEETEFTCKLNNECIHEAWRCDGDDDCADGSDEKNCECILTFCHSYSV